MKQFSYNSTLGVTILFVYLALSGDARAEGSAETSGAGTPRYLAPEEITQADYDMMSDYAYRYNSCLNKISQEQMDKQPDPRHIVDYAMKQCAPELEELDRKMTARNFDPAYRHGYIGKVSRKSVNDTLHSVMMGMASRQSPAPVPAQ